MKAHFLSIPRKGVEPCENEPIHLEAVRNQERADGKIYQNVSSFYASTTGAPTGNMTETQSFNTDAVDESKCIF